MTDWQIAQAIDLLSIITEVPLEEIEEYNDYALDAWCNELGFEWDERKQAYTNADEDAGLDALSK